MGENAANANSRDCLDWDLSNLAVALSNAMEQWSYSNCDRSYFNCNVVKSGALTIAMMINEAVKYSY